MTIIIGIDPGSRRTGYGIIRVEGNRHIHLNSGYLDLTRYETPERLQHIYLGLRNIMETYQPNEAAIEQIFMHENPNSALKLGQAKRSLDAFFASRNSIPHTHSRYLIFLT